MQHAKKSHKSARIPWALYLSASACLAVACLVLMVACAPSRSLGERSLTGARLHDLSTKIQEHHEAQNPPALPGSLQALASGDRSPRLHISTRDAWGRPIRYQTQGGARFQLRSSGVDGIFHNSDDIVWNEVASIKGKNTTPEEAP